MERLFVLRTLSRTQQATKICGDLPETTALLLLTRGQLFLSEATIVYNIRPCPKRCLLMPLTRVVAGTKSTTLQLRGRRGQFPRNHWRSTKQYAVCAEGFAFFYAHLN